MDYSAYPVLFVDDELENARAFELAFRRDFSILKAGSAREALEVLSKQRVAVVLSDHRMPGMTGTQLLARIREITPRVVRLLVTAYGDAATLAQAINDGAIYRYVAKPWSIDEMRNVVRQAIELFALEGERESVLRDLSTLNELTQGVSQQCGVEAVAEYVVRAVVMDFGYDGAQLFLANTTGALEPVASLSSGQQRAERGGERRISQGGAREVLRSLAAGSAVKLDLDQVWEHGLELRAVLTDVAAEEVLLVPLRGRRGMLGALAIDNRRGGRRFSDRDTRLLNGIASVGALALEHALLASEVSGSVARRDDPAHARMRALAQILAREAKSPLEGLARDRRAAGDVKQVENAIQVLAGCIEILEVPEKGECDLDWRIGSATMLTASLASERNVTIHVRKRTGIKVIASDGLLLELIAHLLELAIYQAGDSGRVVVDYVANEEAVELIVISEPASEVVSDSEEAAIAEDIRAACGRIAGALKGSLELAEETGGKWHLRLDAAV